MMSFGFWPLRKALKGIYSFWVFKDWLAWKPKVKTNLNDYTSLSIDFDDWLFYKIFTSKGHIKSSISMKNKYQTGHLNTVILIVDERNRTILFEGKVKDFIL